jgi:hypothetical protein
MKTDIVEKLTFWKHVYPEDMSKLEGNLYMEAREEILRLRSSLKAHHSYPTLYAHCIKQLRKKRDD